MRKDLTSKDAQNLTSKIYKIRASLDLYAGSRKRKIVGKNLLKADLVAV